MSKHHHLIRVGRIGHRHIGVFPGIRGGPEGSMMPKPTDPVMVSIEAYFH